MQATDMKNGQEIIINTNTHSLIRTHTHTHTYIYIYIYISIYNIYMLYIQHTKVSALIRAWEGKLEIMTDRLTDQPNNQPTDRQT